MEQYLKGDVNEQVEDVQELVKEDQERVQLMLDTEC